MSRPARLYLSPPHIGENEQAYVAEAFSSNWVSPVGPNLDAFEKAVAAYCGCSHALALSSGTAALHLALIGIGATRGDEVWCSTLTFAGSANPISYCGAAPVFVDCDERSWNCDPALIAQALDDSARTSRPPKAIIVVDLYGQCADYDALSAACRKHGVQLIEDAAEAIGARYKGRAAGSFGQCGVFSFNGNKIITTSGGGMLVSNDGDLIRHARHLSTQARDPAPWYQHSEIGYNYRLSNVLAGIGRGQLEVLGQRVEARRRIFSMYHQRLAGLPGISFMPSTDDPAAGTRCTRWLSVAQISPHAAGCTSADLRDALTAEDIESRPVWKPMHLQPVFAQCRRIGGQVSERLFDNGLCLPSGSAMSEQDVDRVCEIIIKRLRP